jgi:hypothetical protein
MWTFIVVIMSTNALILLRDARWQAVAGKLGVVFTGPFLSRQEKSNKLPRQSVVLVTLIAVTRAHARTSHNVWTMSVSVTTVSSFTIVDKSVR